MTFTIVGVAEGSFKGVADPWTPSEFWITAAQDPRPGIRNTNFACIVIGRLASNVWPVQAQAIVAEQMEQWRRTLPGPAPADSLKWHVLVTRASSVRTPFDPSASLVPARLGAALMVVVATVLLISAVNVVALLLARGVSRSGELAVRLVIGIVGLVLREGLTLAAVSSVAGAVFSYPALRLASKLLVAVPAMDVVAFTTVPLLLTAVVLLACYVPSCRAVSADPMQVLRQL